MITLKPYQKDAVRRLVDRRAAALFAKIGSGKTLMLLYVAYCKWMAGQIDGVLVVSKNNPHRQWVYEELPKLIPGEKHDYAATPEPPPKLGRRFCIYATNSEKLARKNTAKPLIEFMKSGRMMLIIDESQRIKTSRAKTTKTAMLLGALATCRFIASGFPNPLGLIDLYSQYKFLDPDILGCRTKGQFLDQYCVMGGFKNRQIIGYKNEKRFHRLVAPYTVQIVKTDRNVPPNYVERVVPLTREQSHLIKTLRERFVAYLESGERIDAGIAITRLIRIQQIACGWAVSSGQDLKTGVATRNVNAVPEARTDTLRDLLDEIPGKVVVWCRFRACIERLGKLFGDSAVTYHGGTPQSKRPDVVRAFQQKSHVKLFIAQPQSAGEGLNGLTAASTDIYWANNFDASLRVQCEGRIDRIGQRETPTHIDLIAPGTFDRHILKALRQRRNVADAILADIESWKAQ